MVVENTMEDRNDELEDKEEDLDDQSHKKLLNAVSQIYRKQRISAPKRNEPFHQISEFNLTKSAEKKKVGAQDLLRHLSKKPTHRHITAHIESIRKKAKPLPKPLEKSVEEKLVRQSGFQEVEKQLWKYEALIQRNRAADQLVFPLKDDTVKFERNADFLSTFTKPSELELKMAEALKKSLLCQEGKPDEEPDEKMSLEELFRRRNMIAKMRARESYRIAKAVRQNKIKSKKYHRLLKRERIKQELKEFELLQKTDPEAALAKLERVEKARAEERISLRHRNTGKWAKGLALRAKYDSEARSQLADNLRKSREITAKLKSSIATDSEDEDDDDANLQEKEKSADNPWVTENEVTSFVSGYRKFWENQNKEKRGEDESTPNNVSGGEVKEGDVSGGDVKESDDSAAEEAEGPTEITTSSDPVEDNQGNGSVEFSKLVDTADDTMNTGDGEGIGKTDFLDVAEGQPPTESEDTNENITVVANQNRTTDNVEVNCPVSEDISSAIPRGSRKKRKSKSTCVDKISTWSVVEIDDSIDKNCVILECDSVRKKLRKRRRNSSNAFEVSNTNSDELDKTVDRKRKVENLFDEVEMSIEETLMNKMTKTADVPDKASKPQQKPNNDKNNDNFQKRKSNHKDLSFKKSGLPGMDESLIEMAGDDDVTGVSSGMSDVHKLVHRLGDATEPKAGSLPDIDPQKFLPVKRQKLDTAIPDFEEGGDSESDDEREENRLNLMEAFADDDIADEFRKEKEEEEKDYKAKEIDLSLPGWGSWGGSGIVHRRKNKKKAKFPKIPRKDDKKCHIIINEEPSERFSKLKVSDLPQQYGSVAAYEAAIRAPIGDTWVTQLAHSSLIAPQITTKMGAVIEPLDASVLLKSEKDNKTPKVNGLLGKGRGKKSNEKKFEKKKPSTIQKQKPTKGKSTSLAKKNGGGKKSSSVKKTSFKS